MHQSIIALIRDCGVDRGPGLAILGGFTIAFSYAGTKVVQSAIGWTGPSMVSRIAFLVFEVNPVGDR